MCWNNLKCDEFRINFINHFLKNYSFKTRLREYFARVKCVLDIYVLYTSPKFLGSKIYLNHWRHCMSEVVLERSSNIEDLGENNFEEIVN